MRTHSVPTVVEVKDVPEATRSLSTFADPDYVDLFTVTTGEPMPESPEQWARRALESLSPTARFLVWQVACGLRLETRLSATHVAGWKIADHGEGWIRLEAASWFMAAQAVIQIEAPLLSIALFVRYDHPMASLLWPPIAFGHRRAMPGLLRHAASSRARSST